jgi:hypothetical protein
MKLSERSWEALGCQHGLCNGYLGWGENLEVSMGSGMVTGSTVVHFLWVLLDLTLTSTFTFCLRVSTVVMKHLDNVRRKGFVCLKVHCSSLKEVKTGTKAGRNLEAGANARVTGGCFLLACSIMACSVCFLIKPRTTSPGVALPTMG